MAVTITEFQERVYILLLQIPPSRLTSYAMLSRALHSSPRAVGGALRNNPYCPVVPCHRVISATGYIGGYKGEDALKEMKAPSGVNQKMKRELLKEEGVKFNEKGMLLSGEKVWYDGPWDLDGKASGAKKELERVRKEGPEAVDEEKERLAKKVKVKK